MRACGYVGMYVLGPHRSLPTYTRTYIHTYGGYARKVPGPLTSQHLKAARRMSSVGGHSYGNGMDRRESYEGGMCVRREKVGREVRYSSLQ